VLLENFYTTKMSAQKKKLQHRFSKIRSGNGKKSKTAALIISLILTVCVLCATVAVAVINKKNIDSNPDNTLTALETDKRIGDKFNFLVLGLDNNNRADTIMLISFGKNTVRGFSIPRDTVFTTVMADGKIRKISDILSEEKGDQLVVDAICNKLDIPITYYMKVKLSAVETLIDSVGGLEFDVPMNMKYEDSSQNLNISLTKGRRTLTGAEVCGLLQFRNYANGDITRIEMGHAVIKEFLRQKLSEANIEKLPELIEIIKNNVVTNYTLADFSGDINKFKQVKTDISFKTVPGRTLVTDTGIAVYEIDSEKLKDEGIYYE